MTHEHRFTCPLPNGLHARPASLLADAAAPFSEEILLSNERTGAVANAKSVLALVGIDVAHGDLCRLSVSGRDGHVALQAMRSFIESILPTCDEALPAPASNGSVELPRGLRDADLRWERGAVVCPGIGRGAVVIAGGLTLPAGLRDEPPGPREKAQERVRLAIQSLCSGIEARLAARPPAIEAGILRAHLSIATDASLLERVLAEIAAGRSVGQAIVAAAEFFAARLRNATSEYVRERALDVEDIGLQLLENVFGERGRAAGIELQQASVVAAENLTPRQLLALDRTRLSAILLEHAGATSHAVILARSFNIPTLTGVTNIRAKLHAGREVIVDANLGIVITELSAPVCRHYEREQRVHVQRRKRLIDRAREPALTTDRHGLEVAANVSTPEELAPAFADGADGVGLFRTEMLFMNRDAAPSEEEQFAAYQQAARVAGGKPVIIRTFDIGGDKHVPYLKLPQESNPFLGYRGVRLYREHQNLLDAQLRAILRASAYGQVWLLAPMIGSLAEVQWMKERVAAIAADLKARGISFAAHLRFGVMLEVPSACFIIDQLATEVDFFSIGTNDLVQYFLAVDRDSDQVAELYNARHPAFLRLLDKIVADAHRVQRWIGMCGEMTRSPRNLPLLVGLGLDEISTAGPEIPGVKFAVRRHSRKACRALLDRALQCSSASEVEAAVAAFRGGTGEQRLIDSGFIQIASDSVTKHEAIREALNTFFVAGRTEDRHAIEEAVWAREAVYSTGLGHGFAIPHCKTDAISENSIAVIRLQNPIEWDSLDGQPVRCMILLAMRATDGDGAHMRVFSRLARKLMHDDFRARLLGATHESELMSTLTEELELSAPGVAAS